MPLLPGARVGRFTIIDLIGQGGMGGVYRAEDSVLHRTVALKVLHPTTTLEDPTGSADAARLLREGRAAAVLDHPNTVAIFDVGEADGVAYMAMEFLPGKTMRAYVRDESVTLERRLGWLLDVAHTLASAHKRGVVHRDIKPENVMIRDDGVVKVLDFGIARRTGAAVDPNAATQHPTMGTGTGEHGIVGTPVYMAPEQMRGDRADGASDQFAWGVLAYEMLTGAPPWDLSQGALQLVAQILSLDPPPPSARDARIARVLPGVDAVVLRALQKRPGDRFANMSELIAALQTAASEDASESKPPVSTAAPRRSYAIPLVAALCVVCASALVAAGRFRARPPPPSGKVSEPASLATQLDSGSATSANPDALVAFTAGMQAIRDGADESARARFERAAALDPGFAPAHLRRALVSWRVDTTAREHYERAFQLRATLGSHDRALLDVLTAVLRTPASDAEIDQRLSTLEAQPDSDDLYVACRLRRLRSDFRLAAKACNGAWHLDPAHAGARAMEARALSHLGDTKGAFDAYEECLRLSPSASNCLADLATLDKKEGRCVEAVGLTRRLIAIEPENATWRELLASMLVDAGESMESHDEALRQYWRSIPDAERRIDEPRALSRVAVYRGDFREAQRRMRDRAASLESDANEDIPHIELLQEQAMLAFEVGRPQDAVAVAEAYLKQRAVWNPGADARIDASTFLYEGGKLSRAEFAARRDEWLQAAGRRATTWWSWQLAFARASVTPGDAREAIDARKRFGDAPGPMDQSIEEDYSLGAMYARAGDPRSAIPLLKRATASCARLVYPFQHVRAFAALGDALAETGDVAGACEALRVVLDRWGNALPLSTTAARARAEWARLACAR